MLTPDDNGTFLVTCPALPEVTTFGETEADGARNAVGAIEEAIAARIAAGAEIPDPTVLSPASPGAMIAYAPLPLLADFKIGLYEELRAAGITRAELARRLDWNRNSVDRLFMLEHASRLDQLEAAAGALGKRLRAEFVNTGAHTASPA